LNFGKGELKSNRILCEDKQCQSEIDKLPKNEDGATAIFDIFFRNYCTYSVSQNVTNLILNNINKLEPILLIFAHSVSGIFVTNHNYILLLNLL